jgi:hypothetical protein
MEYRPAQGPGTSTETGPYDARFGKYNYSIKAEIPATVDKAEAPGPAHAATEPADQQGPQAATMQKQKAPPAPKKIKLPTIKISKSEAEIDCPVCGKNQFVSGKFCGCACFYGLAKAVKSEDIGESYVLTFKPDWDAESILTLLESFRKA